MAIIMPTVLINMLLINCFYYPTAQLVWHLTWRRWSFHSFAVGYLQTHVKMHLYKSRWFLWRGGGLALVPPREPVTPSIGGVNILACRLSTFKRTADRVGNGSASTALSTSVNALKWSTSQVQGAPRGITTQKRRQCGVIIITKWITLKKHGYYLIKTVILLY